MRCRTVHACLAAYRDRELAPGEHVQVEEHLQSCADCRDLDALLVAATPRPELVVPLRVLRDMERRLDPTELLRVADETPTPTPKRRWLRWLRRDTQVSIGAVLAYSALLATCAGWGTWSWYGWARLEADVAARAQQSSTVAQQPLPAAHYQPAAFAPEQPALRPADAVWQPVTPLHAPDP